jgi:hypothetical protein
VAGHEQAVDVKQRQSMEQHVVRTPAPGLMQREGVRGKIAMRDHRAFRPAGGAGGIEQHGGIVGRNAAGVELVAERPGFFGERALAVGVERIYMLQPARPGQFTHAGKIGGAADHRARRGVVEIIFDFGGAIGGVEREINQARAQAAEIEKHRRRRFLDLRRDAVARPESQVRQKARVARAFAFEIAIAVIDARGCFDKGVCQRFGETLAKQVVEVAFHDTNARLLDRVMGGVNNRPELLN